MNTPERTSLTLLTGAGFASSVLCVFLSNNDYHFLLPGALFGTTVALYFALAEDFRTPLRLLAFLCACSASYPLSMFSAFGYAIVIHQLTGTPALINDLGVPLIDIFIGGCVGACVVLFSGILLFGPSAMSRWVIGAIVLCTVGGGVLGILGGEIDRQLSPANNNTQAGVFVVWQTGVALMLGLLLQWMRGLAATTTEQPQSPQDGRRARNISVPAALFLGCVLAAFGYFILRSFESNSIAKRRATLINKLVAEEPSRTALGPLEPLAAEQIFVMHEVSGLRPLQPMDNTFTTWKSSAPMLHVSTIGYGLDVAHSMPSLQRKVFVQVLQLPNIEWARYQTKYAATQVSADCPSCVSGVEKFGNRVTQISQQLPGDVSYLWSSENLVLSVTKENADAAIVTVAPEIAAAEEDVLRLYLEKYPSK